jgi:hypothetical protein
LKSVQPILDWIAEHDAELARHGKSSHSLGTRRRGNANVIDGGAH